MTDSERIVDPSLIQTFDLSVGVSGLDIATPPALQTQTQSRRATLVLLQPLACAEMLQACHNPASRVTSAFGPGWLEHLNIQPLSKAWRQALMKVPPISRLTFDLNLPRDMESETPKVYWDTNMPLRGGPAISMQNVMGMVITIATVMRMRTKGRDLYFDVVYDGTDQQTLDSVSGLKRQLLALTGTKASV